MYEKYFTKFCSSPALFELELELEIIQTHMTQNISYLPGKETKGTARAHFWVDR